MPNDVLNRLLDLTRHSNNGVKVQACLALGDGAPISNDVVKRLMELTSHSNNDVKGAAARALGKMFGR